MFYRVCGLGAIVGFAAFAYLGPPERVRTTTVSGPTKAPIPDTFELKVFIEPNTSFRVGFIDEEVVFRDLPRPQNTFRYETETTETAVEGYARVSRTRKL